MILMDEFFGVSELNQPGKFQIALLSTGNLVQQLLSHLDVSWHPDLQRKSPSHL